MFTDITSIFLMFVLVIVAVCGIFSFGKKKISPNLFKSKNNPSLQFSQPATSGYPPALIDRPILDQDEHATITRENAYAEDPKIEIIEDEETALLKAAEIIVEKVQDTVTNLASTSPNANDVFTRIKSIVSQYRIFDGTEYFDAINSFISVTVERDCNIKFTKDQLLQLWV
jgi:hypothetical protein